MSDDTTSGHSAAGQAQEVWLPAVGFTDYVEVSNLGRVRTLAGETLDHYRGAYSQVRVRPGPGGIPYVHLLVAETFIGPRPAGLQTRHLNGDSFDNRVTNLRYGTARENAADRELHARYDRKAHRRVPR